MEGASRHEHFLCERSELDTGRVVDELYITEVELHDCGLLRRSCERLSQAPVVEGGYVPLQMNVEGEGLLLEVRPFDGVLPEAEDCGKETCPGFGVLLYEVAGHEKFDDDTCTDADQEVGRHGDHEGRREDQCLLLADVCGVLPHRRLAELPADADEHGCEHRLRNGVHDGATHRHEKNHEHGDEEGGPLSPSSCLRVGSALDAAGDAGDGAEEGADEVGDADAERQRVGVGFATEAIFAVDRLAGRDSFDGADERQLCEQDRTSRNVVTEIGEVRHDEPAPGVEARNLDEEPRVQVQGEPCERSEYDHRDGGRDRQKLLCGLGVQDEHQHEADERQCEHAVIRVTRLLGDGADHLPELVAVGGDAHDDGELLGDDDGADRRQHRVNDGGGKEPADLGCQSGLGNHDLDESAHAPEGAERREGA